MSSVRVARARSLRKRMTPQEVRVWCELRLLRPAGLHFRRQVPIGPYVVDFACRSRGLVVELDGGQHAEDAHRGADALRDARLTELGFEVLRFWNNDVNENIGAVIDKIVCVAETRPISRHQRWREELSA